MKTPEGVSFAVLIPSRNRGRQVSRLWNGRMNFLDMRGVYLGVDVSGADDYDISPSYATVTTFSNPLGSVSYARQKVKRAVREAYSVYVLADDNTTFTEESLMNLVRAQVDYQRRIDRPVVMAWVHGTAAHFDRTKVEGAVRYRGLRSYERVSMMFWAIPGSLYDRYTYPDDAYGYDDRHLTLWLMARGVRDFRVCVDAPFAKARYQTGGQGPLTERIRKNARGSAALLRDFPDYMGLFDPHIPWRTVLKYTTDGLTERLGRHNAR